MDISEDTADEVKAEFTYSVRWHATEVSYDRRMDKYRRYQFLPQHLEVTSSAMCNVQISYAGLALYALNLLLHASTMMQTSPCAILVHLLILLVPPVIVQT